MDNIKESIDYQLAVNHSKTKVVCLGLNPALDLTGWLPKILVNSVNQVERSDFHAAGKAINVAKILSQLKVDVTITGFLGADNQTLFCNLFKKHQIIDKMIRIEQASTRINVKLTETGTEHKGDVSDINFPGFSVSKENLLELEDQLISLAKDHSLFIFTGSLPKDVPTNIYARWIKLLSDLNCKVILDSSKEALVEAIESKEAKPWLIKPNDEELMQWFQTMKKGESKRDEIELATQLQQQGIENVILSQGDKGSVWIGNGSECSTITAIPPKMEVISTVGAGDTLVAGICFGYLQQWTKERILRFATALAADAVTQEGVGVEDLCKIESIMEQVKIKC